MVDRDVHEIGPGEGYDIDSDEFDSDDEAGLDQAEYDRLVDEGESESRLILWQHWLTVSAS